MANRTLKTVVITSIAWCCLIGITIGASNFAKFGFGGPCVNEERSVYPNPEYDREVVVYSRSCGATTHVGTIVGFRDDSSENGFVDIFIPVFGSPLSVEWENKATLNISTLNAESYLKTVKRQEITINYLDYYFPHKQF